MPERSIGLILLAAGSSERMGRPKQLLQYLGESLIRRSINAAQAACFDPIVAVLGAYEKAVGEEIRELEVIPVGNPRWEEGMGSSIQTGIETLLTVDPEVSAAMVMLCDQPMVDSAFLQKLKLAFLSGTNKIVATSYGNKCGVPAIFDKCLFAELQQLNGKEGAQGMMMKYQANVLVVDAGSEVLDIDTEEDYRRLLDGERKE